MYLLFSKPKEKSSKAVQNVNVKKKIKKQPCHSSCCLTLHYVLKALSGIQTASINGC